MTPSRQPRKSGALARLAESCAGLEQTTDGHALPSAQAQAAAAASAVAASMQQLRAPQCN